MPDTTVLVFGTFDLFHEGHKYFLRQAKQHGTRVVVIVARDKNVLRIKGHAPHDSEQQRLQQVQAFPTVDEARLGYEDWRKRAQVLDDIQPDVICLGYDQQAVIPPGPWVVLRLGSFQPDVYKSSRLRPLSK